MQVLQDAIAFLTQVFDSLDGFLSAHQGISVLFGGLIGAVLGQLGISFRGWLQGRKEKHIVKTLLSLEIVRNYDRIQEVTKMLDEVSRELESHAQQNRANVVFPALGFETQAYDAFLTKLPETLELEQTRKVLEIYGCFRTAKQQYETFQKKDFKNLGKATKWVADLLRSVEDLGDPLTKTALTLRGTKVSQRDKKATRQQNFAINEKSNPDSISS